MINFNKVEFLTSVGDVKQFKIFDKSIPEIVFSGKSNVGKSSLINKILNRKSIARVSAKPGKTVNLNIFQVDTIRFVDLPGYGYAQVSKSEKERWGELVNTYLETSKNIKLVIQILDMRHPATEQDHQMLDYLYKKNFNFAMILSKSDKLNKTEYINRKLKIEEELEKYKNIKKIFFSSKTGEGLEDLKNIINLF